MQNGSVSDFGYTNNAIGNRTAMSRAGSAFSTPDTISYSYNSRSEVIGAVSNQNSAYNYAYSFDPIGNRLTANLAGTSYNYTTNMLNQYTVVNSNQPTYDDDGNMLTNGGWTYTWNGENRMVQSVNGNTKLQFVYDYMGRRVEKKVFDGDTVVSYKLFVYDDYKQVEELDALNSNSVLKRYSWQPEAVGLDVPLSMTDVATTKNYAYTLDANKNVSDLTDAQGNVVAHYEYSPFGTHTATGSYTGNQFRFSSEVFDSETGLIYYNYRYYNPSLGRWINRDPIEEQGGWNLYVMVYNNMITWWDKLGTKNIIDYLDDFFSTKEKSDKINYYRKKMQEVDNDLAKATAALNECLAQYDCTSCGTSPSRTQGVKTSVTCTHICKKEQAAVATANARRNSVLTDMAADGIEDLVLSKTGVGGKIVSWAKRIKEWFE